VRIALKEHKDDADRIAIAVDSYLFVARQVSRVKSDIDEEIKSHQFKINRLKSELAEAQKNCPCPASAMVYHGDNSDSSSDSNYSYHECRICGKTH
jgi:hypothetical protein